MAAAISPIELEEHSDLTFEFIYRDADGNANDVTNWGATIVLAEEEGGDPIYTGHSTDSDAPVIVGGTDGKIETQVPYDHYQNLNINEGYWELYIYPTAGDHTDRPKKLLKGPFTYNKSSLKDV